jgi:hypothetical protein
MRTDEPDVDHSVWVIDPDNDAILVSGDIEDDTTVPENAGAPKVALYGRW